MFGALSLLIGLPNSAHAAPPGKAWAPIEGKQEPGYDYIVGPRLDLTAQGKPRLYGTAVKVTQRFSEALAYEWVSGGWAPARALGITPVFLFHVDAAEGEHPLLFGGGTEPDRRKLFWAEDDGFVATPPEHIATTIQEYGINFAGSASANRSWAATEDIFQNNGFLRIFSSVGGGAWQELPIDDPASGAMSMLAVDDTTMMLVWDRTQVSQGLGWGVLRGDFWQPVSEPIRSGYFTRPRLRRHPEGGAWLTYGPGESLESAGIRRLEAGAWGPEFLLNCAYPGGAFGNSVGLTEMSHDDAAYPVVAWTFSSFLNGSQGVCVCIPDENGWGVGEEIYRGGSAGIHTVLRDGNGDVWVAWGDLFQPLRWTHTYTKATAAAPLVSIAQGRPELAWKLSEAAPGTWWAVLRQHGNGAFVEVARVQAGALPEMSWIDEDYHPGTLLRDAVSYRIRRESVDTRYEQLGPIGSWKPGHVKLHLAIRPQGPGGNAFQLELGGSTGSRIELTIYDVSGRAVERRDLTVRGGAAMQSLPLTFAPGNVPAGIYFARVRDESGAVSDGAKFVRLR